MKYKKTSAYECTICGDLHGHPSLAEKCYNKCHIYQLFKDIAKARNGNTKLEIASMIEDLEETRDEIKFCEND